MERKTPVFSQPGNGLGEGGNPTQAPSLLKRRKKRGLSGEEDEEPD